MKKIDEYLYVNGGDWELAERGVVVDIIKMVAEDVQKECAKVAHDFVLDYDYQRAEELCIKIRNLKLFRKENRL